MCDFLKKNYACTQDYSYNVQISTYICMSVCVFVGSSSVTIEFKPAYRPKVSLWLGASIVEARGLEMSVWIGIFCKKFFCSDLSCFSMQFLL